MPDSNNAQIVFPEKEFKVQSPFLYLQAVGSTGTDGSTYGAHLRWLLLRNLGESHLPKADYAATTINFNRPSDYVTLLRSQYVKRFPTTVDLSLAPDVVNDAQAFWIYTNTNTGTVVYIHFRDTAKYAALRAALGPSIPPLQFIERYCPALIEAELKDKLFFAAEFEVERTVTTMMRVEALSVETNVPLSPMFVSCRKVFTDRNWCSSGDVAPEPKTETSEPARFAAIADVPACCDGPNMLSNGSFEAPAGVPFGFETAYALGGAKSGAINVTTDAAKVKLGWVGLPHSGQTFLTVDGSEQPGLAVLRFKREVDPGTSYCFTGWLATLWLEEVSIPLQFRFTADDGTVQSFAKFTPATIRTWEEFSLSWNSGSSRTVTVEIISLSIKNIGNDFGIDDLWFCKGRQEPASVPACCGGPNLLSNGGFEFHPAFPAFLFETDYELDGGAKPGAINVARDASTINRQWEGLPHGGGSFLCVDGIERADSAVLRFNLDVNSNTDYCFTGWLATLWKHDVSIPLEFRFTSADGNVQSFKQTTPSAVRKWEEFAFKWNSGAARSVTVEIISLSVAGVGNDFGIDDLWFCKSKPSECRARIMSENIRSVRFEVSEGYPRRLEFETYQDYISGALWDKLEDLALTTSNSEALRRLEPAPNTVNGHWQKFNDNALLNVANYDNRWSRSGGLKEGVERYIARSDIDPLAIVNLAGDAQPQDGSIQISLLDALRMVSLDFHVARMLGMGLLDQAIVNDNDEFIYLGVYDTDGPLDDTKVARPVRHYFMSVPTRPLDHRLPDMPVLKPVTYGLAVDNGETALALLTDPQGYTPDGLSRYLNLFVETEPDLAGLDPFFVPPVEFCSSEKTASVFYGIEYRKQSEGTWRKPEIAHDADYEDLDAPPQFETLPLPNNADSEKPILRHEERENGVHEYGCYGVNWFSRVSPVGNMVATDATLIKKTQRLLPPANLAVQLIQSESPLMLTTKDEQLMLTALPGPDRTLVRVTFDYFHTHDLNYDFADRVELFFRSEMPRNVVGAVKSVVDDPSDNHQAIIRTMDYAVNSQGTTISPTLASALFANFIGGVFSCQQENYIITDISSSTQPGEGPVFTLQKNVRGNASDPGSTGAFLSVQEYVAPDLALSNGPVMFMAVENLADPQSWGHPNPLSKVITIGDGTWAVQQETYVQDGDTVTVNLRGIWGSATVTHTPTAVVSGVYEIAFDTYQLQNHPQHGDSDPVEWYKGAVRVSRAGNPNGPKKVLEVLRIKHLGDGQPLVLHVLDNAYDSIDPILTGPQIEVNYYPGYKVYLHADAANNFTAGTILPAAGEGNRKTWLGARSGDSTQPYFSAVGIPAPIVALEFIKPLPPERPSGGEFATWPDYYFKSSYTFTMNFAPSHKPFAIVMYRANDEAILRALYNDATYNSVRQQLEILGEDDPHRSDRWKNLLGFDYVYDVNSLDHPFYDPTGSNPNGTFRKFPRETGYAFPNPDKGGALNGTSLPGNILPQLKEAIWGAFTSLTELPLVYDFIKGPSFVPVPRPQHIRNDQGALLDPNDPAFEIAPMAKRTGNGNEIQFTDFTLDGTSINIFFYYGREIGNRGRMGDPGGIAGPVQLINTRPPDAPAVKKMYVDELNLVAATGPAVRFEVNAYPEVQKIGRMQIYRSTNPADGLSVRTMELVKTIDLAQTTQTVPSSIFLTDDFESGFVPYGDPLVYRIVAMRPVKNPDGGTDWAPSQPSKLLLTTVPDTINPEAPAITFNSNGLSGSPATLSGVILAWSPTVHNGTYYLDKMNANGSWVTIYRLKTNDNVTIDLAATELGTNVLPKETEDGDASVYHRFRVVTENSSGLFSLTDKVLTL